MSEYRRNQEHVAQGLDRLLERFKNKPNLEAVLGVILKRVQRIDDVLWDLYTGMWLDNAVGVQLDALGWIVGEARKGRQDAAYKLYIRARIRINRSNGKIVDSIEVLRLILESGADFTYTEEWPAAYKLEFRDTLVSVAELFALANEVRPAGVGLTAVTTPDSDTAFIWDAATPLTNGWDAGLWSDDRST